MFVAILAFLFGKNKYIEKERTGNVFAQFCQATWNGLRNKCKSKNKDKDHFLDYADKERFGTKKIEEYKFVYPLIVMYLPLPFFWALFDMQGSRWTLSGTQYDMHHLLELNKIHNYQLRIAY